MRRILAQAQKELAQFSRDRLTVALAFLLPLGMLLIYGYAIRLETKNIPLVFKDFDNSFLSRTYIERIFATQQFIPVSAPDLGDPVAAIDRDLAKVAIIIPPDFSQKIKTGKTTEVQVLVDGTDVNNARVIQNSIRATTNFFLQSTGLIPELNLIQTHTRLWFNPGRKESLYIVPGIYGVILWVFPSMLASIAMVREKEQGTILQVYASDLTSLEWLLGKEIAYVLVGIGEAAIVMGVSVILFDLKLAGNSLTLLVGTAIFLMASVAFGLLVGVRASNQNAAVQGTAIGGFLTSFLLSGFIYPIANIPFPLSLLSKVIPARYYIILTRDAFLRGTGWEGVWYVPMVIGTIGLLLFLIANKAIKRMQLPD
ncbi:ABC transporter permease [Oxynema sp. CENA135]|uniref:ABC transporter permease n=1 Tax=Oxynema sp. CENA135 TaxID=984206 RepID=UPI00190ABD9D|nr:ABC transporter permease [Oxynema sp. CENA135]MBK4729701.1 ABC transporter permease [Oxynema sp. CENA135]